MFKMTYKIIILFLLLISILFAATDVADKIDTTIITTIDITGNGQDDSISCHLTGDSWKKPITVAYRVICDNSEILSETKCEKGLDEGFKNDEFPKWCDKGYEICKKKWYLKEMHKQIVEIVKPGDEKRKQLFDTTSSASIPGFVQPMYIDSLGYSKNKAAIKAKELVANLQKRDFVLLVLPPHPVYRSFPRLYDPHSKKFLVLYGF